MDLGLRGKVALVTGAARGIGYAIAARLAEEGCDIGICDVKGVEAALPAFTTHGVRAHGVVANVMEPSEVERFVVECAGALGGVDLLVANAGGAFGKNFLESTADDWLKTFQLNLFHAVQSIRSAIPYMRERGGGSILLIASISGWKPAPRSQYGASKAAEIYLASSLAREFAPYMIRVNALSPGSTVFPGGGWDTFRKDQPQRFDDFVAREFPSGRMADPTEIADVAVFLLSGRACRINGANIQCDAAQGQPTVEK